MSKSDNYQLPAGIQMPERFTKRSSYQIWFYSGVQAGLEGHTPQNEIELTQHHGAGIAAAYQAGLAAGQAKRAELEAPAHQIPVPAEYSSSLQERIWFLQGVDDALAGRPAEYPPDLPQRRAAELLRAYKAGYRASKRASG